MTRLACLLGRPVAHSLSPPMQNAAFSAAGIDAVYLAFCVDPAGLGDAIRGLAQLGVLGMNVTVPYKVSVIPLLDATTGEAELAGSVNTIVPEGRRLVGYSTDGAGFLRSLSEELRFEPSGGRCLVIGAGGAGISLIAELEPEEARALLARRATQPGGAPGMTSVLPRFRDVLATRIPHSWSILDAVAPGNETERARDLQRRSDPRETGTESATGTPPRVAQQPATQPSFGYRPDRPAG